jgi:hypothetical protein
MLDTEHRGTDLKKEGLPPRDRSADVSEHANSSGVLLGGIIAVGAVVALLMFGGSGNQHSASNSLNTEPGTTTGAAPAAPSREMR